MTFFKSALSRLSPRKSAPVIATNVSVDAWCHQVRNQPTRLVRKVDICTALASGKDARDAPVSKAHHHTLLRVFLDPPPAGSNLSEPEDVLLIERVLSSDAAHHAITPIPEPLSSGGSPVHPDVHDRVCTLVSGGTPSKLARHLEVERTLKFGDAPSGAKPRLSLSQFAQVLDFVSHTTTLVCAGGDCQFVSRAFVFTCMAALTPRVPPRKAGSEERSVNLTRRVDWVDDSVFELGAEAFLGEIPWVVRDSVSVQALKLIGTLKNASRETTKARLYH